MTITLNNGDRITGRTLIVSAGPWASEILGNVGVPLTVRRKHVYWFPAIDMRYHENDGCPTFLYELPHGVFYGFPQINERGVKVAEHSGGQVVADPLNDGRAHDEADLGRVQAFLADHLPHIVRIPGHHSVCYYTMSPDENFLVDRHPRHENVLLAAGLSGHGFKFTSVLGEALADLALDGKTSLPIEFLRLSRFHE